jgi:hypothetical protein
MASGCLGKENDHGASLGRNDHQKQVQKNLCLTVPLAWRAWKSEIQTID